MIRTAFITRQPVLTYFTLTFAISWGGFLLAGGSGLFAGTSWRTDPAFLVAVQVMLAGPPTAGLLMTLLGSGTREAPTWAATMAVFVKERGKHLDTMDFFYTTCPQCARRYGKNYVVGWSSSARSRRESVA